MPAEQIESLRSLYKQNKDAAIKDYFKFLEFQSVSSEPDFKEQVLACANWLMDYIMKMGFETELWPTKGHPVIFASHMKAGPDKPTLLIYTHYDVQPVDPLDEWQTPPFQPAIRNGEVYARGAQDNKGQCFYVISALKAMLERDKKLPINIKLCIEGEEETGSAGLSGILDARKDQLRADHLAIVDLGIRDRDSPTITLGIRGIVTMDVVVQGSKTDLHSGFHGGMVYNPLHALVEILSKLRDNMGRIAIPNFYEDVVELSDKDRSRISLQFDEKKYETMFGVPTTGGEKVLSALERAWTRPTIEINGISGGYSGQGFKTVIPSKAMAKLSCRLVPNQDPEKISKLVADFIEKQAPLGVKVKVNVRPGCGKAMHSNPDSKIVKDFAKAYSEVFQKPCEFIFEGGSSL